MARLRGTSECHRSLPDCRWPSSLTGCVGQRQFVREDKESGDWSVLNRRPPACEAGALPTELQPQKLFIQSAPLNLDQMDDKNCTAA